MTETRPGIEKLLSELCGEPITSKDYVGYFLNEHGEEVVFAQRKGEKTARMWHSDMDWQLIRVGDHSVRVGEVLPGVTTVEGMIVDRTEATWLSSCLAASRHLRAK
ncbi:hypothetical protein ACIQF6_21870 [Kitasatospora sp. NPDC092948]|uniref:hypothetical protein n=1 Tax=Kitasatospora sp. NPDC092948 TaxID=3364088 RepID=UPI003828CBB5